ncbi:MAG TPA: RNA 2',3'-cyclic phosphodiesterase [Candidatus Omnitrophica bacterium]|nr:MAG: 2'-5' RNA ligase [Omnitrophica WOR_2 bacterium GWA2_45_18]HBR15381.1 RNA 2',3'-cyclic phosphodiesterase [Candidatus Omnitrophota bacterium]
MSDFIRTFIAMDLNEILVHTIKQVQAHLKSLNCDIKWVKPENIHLTLKFLSDVPLQRIDRVKEVLGNIAQLTPPLRLELTSLGAFPSPERARVIWVGLKDDQKRFETLADSLETQLGNMGFKKEARAFSPHITIGRARSPKNLDALSREMKKYSLPASLVQEALDIVLYKSTLTSAGPVYEELARFPFSLQAPNSPGAC